MPTIKVFNYIDNLDCFVVNPEYKSIADNLGLTEWNEVVWIGRYFAMDNDNGEHWFDNWKARDKIADKAKQIGIDYENLLIIDPQRFKNNFDGPCHSDIERHKFWTDVLKSLELSIDTIVSEASKLNKERDETDTDYVSDLDDRIKTLKKAFL